FPDRILVGPKSTRRCFIENDDGRMIGRVRGIKSTALLQMSTERLKVVAAYRFIKHLRILVRRRLGLALDEERTTAVETIDCLRTADRGVLHAGQRAKAILQFRQEQNPLLIVVVLLSAQAHPCRHQSINLPAWICMNETL